MSASRRFSAAAVALLAAGLLGTLATRAAAQAEPSNVADEKFWITDGSVFALAQDASRVYLGGQFTRVAPRMGGSVRLNAGDGAVSTPFPKVDGAVYAVEPDGAGGWFLGGTFSRVGDTPRNNVAHVLADGRVSNWQAAVDGPVWALVRAGGWVYLGGAFSTVSGAPHNRLARVDTAFGSHDPTWNPDVTGVEVRALALTPGTLYLGGTFTMVNGQFRNNAAEVLLYDASILAWNPDTNGTVEALAVDGAYVYVGGSFTQINGALPRNGLARVMAGGGTMDGTWNPNPDGPVHALELSPGGATLYVGGAFLNIAGASRKRVAALNPGGSLVPGWDPGADDEVRALALSPAGLFMGGRFTSVATQPRRHLAFVDNSGALMPWNPHAFGNVEALAFDQRPSGPNWVYAGGFFAAVGGVTRVNLVALDRVSGAPDGFWTPNPDGPVHALLMDGAQVYVGGEFTTISGLPRNRLALISTVGLGALAWDPDVSGGLTPAVRTLAFDITGTYVYAGGDFTTVNTAIPLPRSNAARFSITTGLADAWDPSPDGTVRRIDDQSLWAGVGLAGDFTNINLPSVARKGFASVDRTLGVVLGFQPNPNSRVYGFFEFSGDYYLGGDFSQLGTLPPMTRNRAGAVKPGLPDTVTAWEPGVSGLRVRTLVQDGNSAILGGSFSALGVAPRNNLAQVDIFGVGAVKPWTPNPGGGDVVAVLPTPIEVFVGGDFLYTGGRLQRSFAGYCKAPPVTAVTATPWGTNTILVNWAPAGVSDYNVYRSDSGQPFIFVGSSTSGATSFIDTNVEGGLLYTYRVRAVFGGGTDQCEGDPSLTPGGCACTTSTTGACGVAPVFDGVADALPKASPTCEVQVRWNSAVGRCGESPTFNVYRSTDPNFTPGASTRAAQGLSAYSWIDSTDVASGTTYYYIVRAYDRGNGEEDQNLIRMPATLDMGCTASPPPRVRALTVRSRNGQNRIEWLLPSGFPTIDLRYNVSPTPDTPCTAPPDTGSGITFGLIGGTPGDPASYPHDTGAAWNGHNFCYTAFVMGGSPSLPDSVAGRPADTPAAVSWVYTTRASTLSRPAIVPLYAYFALSNNRRLHAMTPGPGGGAWPTVPAQWKPPALNAAALGRPTVVNLPTTRVSGAARIALVGAQDGRVYCFNADNGNLLWTADNGNPLGEGIVTPPSLLVSDFGWTPANLVLVGTRNTTSDNSLVALNLADGTVAWRFDNNAAVPGNGIGIISGQPLVEYANSTFTIPARVYFTSRRRSGGAPFTVWAVNVSAASASLYWKDNHGEIDGAITRRGNVLYLGNNEGEIRALSRTTGGQNWAINLTDGPIKGFVWPDALSTRVYASTNTKVVALNDDGLSASPFWASPLSIVPNPSTPLLNGTTLYIGGGDGRLYSAPANVAGPPPLPTWVTLGDPTVLKTLGAPVFDRGSASTLTDDLVLVGSDEGRVYAVHPPF